MKILFSSLLFVITGIIGMVLLTNYLNQPDPITDSEVSWSSGNILVVGSSVMINAEDDEFFVIVNTSTWESYPSAPASNGLFVLSELQLTTGQWLLLHPADDGFHAITLSIPGGPHQGLLFSPTEASQDNIVEAVIPLSLLTILLLYWLSGFIKKQLAKIWARWQASRAGNVSQEAAS